MTKSYIVTVDVDEEELKSLNEKRFKQGQQQYTADERAEFLICAALDSKLHSNSKCRTLDMKLLATRGRGALSEDPDAVL